jgi:hypothetical protein
MVISFDLKVDHPRLKRHPFTFLLMTSFFFPLLILFETQALLQELQQPLQTKRRNRGQIEINGGEAELTGACSSVDYGNIVLVDFFMSRIYKLLAYLILRLI